MAIAAAMAAAYFVSLCLCIVGSLNDARHFGGGVLQVRDAGESLLNPIARLAVRRWVDNPVTHMATRIGMRGTEYHRPVSGDTFF